ncbi:MAG: hypothetical protein LBF12_03480 [Christensenellaceae bacterium]|jgi:hypothetical protein|nr:hypothetical protein [Christensenellaceae bacterium]
MKNMFFYKKHRTNNKNINRFFYIVYISLVLLVLIGLGNFIVLPELFATGDSSLVLHDPQSVISYLNKNYKNLTVNSIYKKIIPNENIKQSALNSYYNNYYNITNEKETVKGTCSEVAVTLLTKAHKVNQGSYQYIFRTVMNTAVDNGYWKEKYGTYQAKIDSLVTKSFDFWGSSKKGNNDHLNIYSNLVENIDNGKTSVFSCSDHSMHAVGYAVYDIKYSPKILFFYGKPIAKKEYFVVVNDGWHDANTNTENKQYSYYPASAISSITFVLTKVV